MAGSRAGTQAFSRDERLFGAGFAALSAVAVAAVLYGTRLGVGLANDSVNYLRAARGLLDGRGLVVMQAFHFAGAVPMTHWPARPLYPLLLAASAWLGLDMETFARAANALLLAANLLLIGRFASDRGGGLAAAVIAALLFSTNREILYVHQMVWTDALFLFTALLTLTFLARHLDTPRPALAWGAGACAALAVMTRYVGIAVVAAGGLGLLLLARAPFSRRVRDALRFAALPCAALALWALRSYRVGDASSYGQIGFRLPELAPLLEPIATSVADWLWPFRAELLGRGWSAGLATTAILGGAAAFAFATRSRVHPAPARGAASTAQRHGAISARPCCSRSTRSSTWRSSTRPSS